MPECAMPAPCEGAGCGEPTGLLDFPPNRPSWANTEISNRPFALDYAAELAVEYAEIVHDMDCEDRGMSWPTGIRQRCADPLLLMRFLPLDATQAVRREAERKLRAW